MFVVGEGAGQVALEEVVGQVALEEVAGQVAVGEVAGQAAVGELADQVAFEELAAAGQCLVRGVPDLVADHYAGIACIDTSVVHATG